MLWIGSVILVLGKNQRAGINQRRVTNERKLIRPFVSPPSPYSIVTIFTIEHVVTQEQNYNLKTQTENRLKLVLKFVSKIIIFFINFLQDDSILYNRTYPRSSKIVSYTIHSFIGYGHPHPQKADRKFILYSRCVCSTAQDAASKDFVLYRPIIIAFSSRLFIWWLNCPMSRGYWNQGLNR